MNGIRPARGLRGRLNAWQQLRRVAAALLAAALLAAARRCALVHALLSHDGRAAALPAVLAEHHAAVHRAPTRSRYPRKAPRRRPRRRRPAWLSSWQSGSRSETWTLSSSSCPRRGAALVAAYRFLPMRLLAAPFSAHDARRGTAACPARTRAARAGGDRSAAGAEARKA